MNSAWPPQCFTESDVEQKVLFYLLTDSSMLGYEVGSVKTKSYLEPSVLEKNAGKRSGYYPDYSVWINGYPVCIVEAKAPGVDVSIGYREACLYARNLNAKYPHDLNPCKFVVSANDQFIMCGFWDVDHPEFFLPIPDLAPGTNSLAQLREFCGQHKLKEHYSQFSSKLVVGRSYRPATFVGGQALLNSRKQLNSFAAELSPVLKRYFSSSSQQDVRDIALKAYVSSNEITDYDRVLESLLKDRASIRRDTIVEPLRTTRADEPRLTKAISEYERERPPSGQLQIIQGGVGAGKSLFARRYKEVLQHPEMAARNYWAFVDFNEGPPDLKGAEHWLCQQVIESFERENPSIDLFDGSVLRGIFSQRIQRRKSVYNAAKAISHVEAERLRAQDISEWQENYQAFAEGLGKYIGANRQSNLIVVMDNVDRLDLQGQLDAFQLSLWFMSRTAAFVILQMRDETYERYKNRPPLDTFRAGIAFHITPPRFIDVVKRRLELGIEYLAENSPRKQDYVLENGMRIVLPSSDLGSFLRSLYIQLFDRRRNISRVLEALSGSDVRRALEMFVNIVTSGHLGTTTITSNVLGDSEFPLLEYQVLRILMRTNYRFFNESSGFIKNIIHFEEGWHRADSFLLVEVLYFLSLNRKRQGPLGLEGYFRVATVCDEVERLGYPRATVLSGINYLLKNELIGADDFNHTEVKEEDSVKIKASGFIHLRVLCERGEYLFGVLPATPFTNKQIAQRISLLVQAEDQRGFATMRETISGVEMLLEYLKYEFARLRGQVPVVGSEQSGAAYLIGMVEGCLRRLRNRDGPREQNELDL